MAKAQQRSLQGEKHVTWDYFPAHKDVCWVIKGVKQRGDGQGTAPIGGGGSEESDKRRAFYARYGAATEIRVPRRPLGPNKHWPLDVPINPAYVGLDELE